MLICIFRCVLTTIQLPYGYEKAPGKQLFFIPRSWEEKTRDRKEVRHNFAVLSNIQIKKKSNDGRCDVTFPLPPPNVSL